MRFLKTPLPGAHAIEPELKGDDRGFFARLYCEKEFEDNGLVGSFVQANNSCSRRKGTLRGMHYQLPPSAEVKVVRCIRGALWDCIADLRPDSPTFGKWFGIELNADNRRMMYVPRGFAHGFLTLADDTEAIYLVSDSFNASAERNIRYDDAFFNIIWPFEPVALSEKDASRIDFNPVTVEPFRGLG